jgi:hypothetical protein
MFLYYSFLDQPGVETSKAAQVAIDGVPRKVSILGWRKTVTCETFQVLQVGDVFPDFLASDIGQKFTVFVAIKVFLKIVDASDHDLDGIGAVAFGRGTKLVAGKEVFGVC